MKRYRIKSGSLNVVVEAEDVDAAFAKAFAEAPENAALGLLAQGRPADCSEPSVYVDTAYTLKRMGLLA